MNGSRFDVWTRRRFGLATGGLAASFLGLATVNELEAKRKRKRKNGRGDRRRGRTFAPAGIAARPRAPATAAPQTSNASAL